MTASSNWSSCKASCKFKCGGSILVRPSRSTRRTLHSPLRAQVHSDLKLTPRMAPRSSPCAMAKAKRTARAPLIGSPQGRRSAFTAPICAITKTSRWAPRKDSSVGHCRGRAATRGRSLPVTLRRKSSATRISTNSEHGRQWPITATCGFRGGFLRVGRPIATAIGHGSIRGDGHGSTMRHGALRRSTMVAGRSSRSVGAGCRVRRGSEPCTRPRLSRSSAEATSA